MTTPKLLSREELDRLVSGTPNDLTGRDIAGLFAHITALEADRDEWRGRAESVLGQAEGFEQHFSSLETSLENVRRERDEAAGKAGRLGEELRAHIRAGVEAAEILAGPGGPLGEGVVAGARRVVAERDRLAAENARFTSLIVTTGAERDAALADSAALLTWVDVWGHAAWCERERDKSLHCSEQCAAIEMLGRPHPGAALLEEISTMRPTWSRLRRMAEQQGRSVGGVLDDAEWHRKALEAMRQECVDAHAERHEAESRECSLKQELSELGLAYNYTVDAFNELKHNRNKALVRARNEGLEKAAQWVQGCPSVSAVGENQAADYIRALKEPEQ